MNTRSLSVVFVLAIGLVLFGRLDVHSAESWHGYATVVNNDPTTPIPIPGVRFKFVVELKWTGGFGCALPPGYEIQRYTQYGYTDVSGQIHFELHDYDIEPPPDCLNRTTEYIEISVDDYKYYLFVEGPAEYQTPNSHNINKTFVVTWDPDDQDGDGLLDSEEALLAEKYSPVVHRHNSLENEYGGLELQLGLANPDEVFSAQFPGKVIRTYEDGSKDELSISAINQIPRDAQGVGHIFGPGAKKVESWKLNFNNQYLDFDEAVLGGQHPGASVGNRPVYYHVFHDDSGEFLYVQYHFFYTMNDIRSQTSSNLWHEGDWDRVSIRIPLNNNPAGEPDSVNFYFHGFLVTWGASECWWGPDNVQLYDDLQMGWSESHSNIHVWVPANAHGSYNRFSSVYHIEGELSFLGGLLVLLDENYTDDLDYWGGDAFEYDYLINLGESEKLSNVTIGDIFYEKFVKTSISSPRWFGFYGIWGESDENFLPLPTDAPKGPSIKRSYNKFDYSPVFSISPPDPSELPIPGASLFVKKSGSKLTIRMPLAALLVPAYPSGYLEMELGPDPTSGDDTPVHLFQLNDIVIDPPGWNNEHPILARKTVEIGGGYDFHLEQDARLTVAAGQKITIKPGTRVDGGGVPFYDFRAFIDESLLEPLQPPPSGMLSGWADGPNVDVGNKNAGTDLGYEEMEELGEEGLKGGLVLPTEFQLFSNFPNPFNPTTTISYALKEASDVSLKIYDLLGHEVVTLVDSNQGPGVKSVLWDGKNETGQPVSSGIYVYRIVAGTFVKSQKMMLMK